MRRRCKGKSSLCLFYFHFQHLYLIYFDQPRQAMCVEDEGAMYMGDKGMGVLGGGRDEQGNSRVAGRVWCRVSSTGTGGGDGGLG